MRRLFSVGATALAVAFVLIAAAPTADAQGGRYQNNSGRMTWRGSVDDTVELYIRARTVRTVVRRGGRVQSVNYSFTRALPYRAESVLVNRNQGRGQVSVFQQPNRANNFTAGVRVRDSQGGRDRYAFTMRW